MKTRDEVPLIDRWNLESLYPNENIWEGDFKNLAPSKESPYWPNLQKFRGTLHQGPESVFEMLELMMSIDRHLSKLYTYAHLKHDENITDPKYKTYYEQIVTFAHSFSLETAWIQPELLSLDDSILDLYLASSLMAPYQFYLEKILRLKKHTLSEENEQLLALSGQSSQTAYKTFNALSDADFKFDGVLDENGLLKPLSHGTYGLYLRDQDRTLRKNAFTTYHRKYADYENTLCELITGQVQNHIFQSRSRHYPSCLEAALYPKNIQTSVYDALITAVHDRLDVLHRYMGFRKRTLNLEEMHLYDIYVPLTNAYDIRISYEEAEDIIIESVKPLGEEYQNLLKKGLKDQRWVDRYENQNKRSGAYSSGCFDSMPYILMNYKNILRDVFTLAHEAGHSMHSLYSRRSQPYQYSDYPIFLAEVASTFNEDLLVRLLLDRCKDPQEKIFLLNQKIEDIRATLFRQTMFAEFERLIHQLVEQGTPLTPQLLKSHYRKLNELYFGPETFIDTEIEIEWARIPHFYYNFYVFQYATGLSAALSLSEKVVNGGPNDREAYLSFLKSGSSKYPIDILREAGVDMTSPLPVKSAIDTFDRLLQELEDLMIAYSPLKNFP